MGEEFADNWDTPKRPRVAPENLGLFFYQLLQQLLSSHQLRIRSHMYFNSELSCAATPRSKLLHLTACQGEIELLTKRVGDLSNSMRSANVEQFQ